jgi:hypothetical protein
VPPPFERLIVCELLIPVTTFPKLALEGVAATCGGCEFTVRVAALLVALPTALLATTVNCAPLSELVVAAVV